MESNEYISSLLFQDLGSRNVVADFSGGTLSSDGGALLLRQMDTNLGLTQRLARCFCDTRQQVYVDHSVRQLLAQRLYGLAPGYEDLNDHQRLRLDPLLAAACEKLDPLGQDRFNPEHRGVALAGASTLNRLELSNNKNTRGHKLAHDPGRIEACLLQMGVRCLPKHARDKEKTRFIPARLYEEVYCARGEMENMLKQQTLDLRADRMSTHYLASNQLRLWLAALAYLLLERMRTQGLAGTQLARATVGSVRLKLLKVAGQARVSVRRVYVQLSSAYPLQDVFRLCHRRLMRLAPAGG